MQIKIDKNRSGIEQIVTFRCMNPKIEGVVAIHNTKLGPALGGCRVYDEFGLAAATKDAVALAKAMTNKNAIAGLPYGGGKSVIIKHGSSLDEVMPYFAKVMNLLNGDYLTTEDVGTCYNDIHLLKRYTKYALDEALKEQMPSAAYGVYQAIRATVYAVEKRHNIHGLKVAVQGLGKLGFKLCEFLYSDGCKLYVNDMKKDLEKFACKEFAATPFAMANINELELDVFSPCALGGAITKNNYKNFKTKYIIAGANNPLSSNSISKILYQKGVIYIPDFLSNAGGVIEESYFKDHKSKYNLTNVFKRIEDVIYNRTIELLDESYLKKLSPLETALERIDKILKN